MHTRRSLRAWIAALAVTTLTAGCGGGPGTATVSGSVSGLAAGTAVTLKLNGKEVLVLGADGGFSFTDELIAEQNYAVTIVTQPANGNCVVQNASGHIDKAASDVNNVTILCVPAYSVGGTLVSLPANTTVTLDNGTEQITLSAIGAFNFPTQLPSGTAYNVTVVTTTPAGRTCNVQQGSGTVQAGPVASIFVGCS